MPAGLVLTRPLPGLQARAFGGQFSPKQPRTRDALWSHLVKTRAPVS